MAILPLRSWLVRKQCAAPRSYATELYRSRREFQTSDTTRPSSGPSQRLPTGVEPASGSRQSNVGRESDNSAAHAFRACVVRAAAHLSAVLDANAMRRRARCGAGLSHDSEHVLHPAVYVMHQVMHFVMRL